MSGYLQHICLALAIIYSDLISVTAVPSVNVSPTNQTVFINDNVEFQCTITDTQNFDLIWIYIYNHDVTIWNYVLAEQTADITETGEDNGMYSVDYSVSPGQSVHDLTLRIEGVMLPDEGQYACGYIQVYLDRFGNLVRQEPVILGDPANLEILVPADENYPSCSFTPDPVTVTSADSSIMVTLKCQINGGKPPPLLTWLRENTPIGQSSEQSNEIQYELTAEDNGIEFVCFAIGPALSVGGPCTVVPLQINPTVTISSDVNMATPVNTNVILNCQGSGLPTISKLEWRYNGRTISDKNIDLDFQIIDISDSSSELHLFNVQHDNNNAIITCYVEVSSGLHSEQSLTLSVIADQPITKAPVQMTSRTTTAPSDIDNQNVFSQLPTFIAIPLAVGFIIILIILAIVIRFCCMKRRERPHSTDDAYVIGELPREAHTAPIGDVHHYEHCINQPADSAVDDTIGNITPSYERNIPIIPNDEPLYIEPI